MHKGYWLLLAAVLLLCLAACGKSPEPEGTISTADFSYRISGNQLLAEQDGVETVIFQGDRSASVLQGALAPEKVYLLCDDVLYSLNADGGGQYKVAEKCYNVVDSLEPVVAESTDQTLGTVRYYDGYVYFVQYGGDSKLCRFQCGGSRVETLAKNQVSAFCIDAEGVLHGYSGPDNLGNWEETLERTLTE